MNVTEIEYQTKLTKEKIAEMDQKPEELPNARENLVAIYKLEKEKQLKANENKDYIGERAEENKTLFKFSEIIDTEENPSIQSDLKSKINQNVEEEQGVFAGRKREHIIFLENGHLKPSIL